MILYPSSFLLYFPYSADLPWVSLSSCALGLALGSPIFPSGCEGEGKLGMALESLQGLRDLT